MEHRIPVPLAAAEPRCEPTAPCARRAACARGRAIVLFGAPLADYTRLTDWCSETCIGFIDRHTLRVPR